MIRRTLLGITILLSMLLVLLYAVGKQFYSVIFTPTPTTPSAVNTM